jgi:hypothetical protein
MSTRIFKASFFCIALTCPAFLAGCTSNIDIPSGTRSEIAQPLQEALNLHSSGSSAAAMQQLKTAEAVPNKTREENQLVARVEARVTGEAHERQNFQPWGPDIDPSQQSAANTASAAPPPPPPPPAQ